MKTIMEKQRLERAQTKETRLGEMSELGALAGVTEIIRMAL